MTESLPTDSEKARSNLFYGWIVLLGILPPRVAILGTTHESFFHRFYKVYALIIVSVAIVAAFLTIVGRFHAVYYDYPNYTIVVTDAAQDITAMLSNVIAIIAPTFFYLSVFDSLLDTYQHTCKTTIIEELLKITSSKKFAMQILVSHMTMLSIFVFDGYVWIFGYGIDRYAFFIYKKVQIYHNFITTLTIYVFVKFMKQQLSETNDYLRENVQIICSKKKTTTKSSVIDVMTKSDTEEVCGHIRKVTDLYQNHVKQIGNFNKLFGCQLLFLTLAFVVGLINSINLIILFCISDYRTDLRTTLILLHILWTLWQLVIGSLAVVVCTETEEVGRETGEICLNALTILPGCDENDRIKDELILLNRLVVQKSPTFSAAGFFSMNYPLLLSIIGSVTSYVIVLIQFNKL